MSVGCGVVSVGVGIQLKALCRVLLHYCGWGGFHSCGYGMVVQGINLGFTTVAMI